MVFGQQYEYSTTFWDLDNIGKPFQIPAEVYHLNTEDVWYSECDKWIVPVFGDPSCVSV